MPVSEREDFFAVEQQTATGFDGEYGNLAVGARRDGFFADARNVEPEILVGLADFDDNRAAFFAGQFAAAPDAGVSAFKTFDGEDGAVLDDDSLADVEPADFLGDFQTEHDVGLLILAGFTAREVTGLRHGIAEEWPGIKQRDTILAEFVGDGAENGFGIANFKPGSHGDHPQIEAEIFEKVCRRDAAGHDGAFDAAFGEHFAELVKLAEFDPFNFIGGLVNCRLGFTSKSGDDDPATLLSGRACQNQREFTVAGNDAKRFHVAIVAGQREVGKQF